MKTINTKNQIQRVTKLIATGALVAVPFLTALPSAEAQPRWNNGNNNNWGRSVTTFEGTVTNDKGGDLFDVRTDNGRIVKVDVGRYREPRSLDRGDRVRVTGQVRGDVFVASNLQFIRDTGNGNWNGNGNSQNSITGVVTRDLAGKSFELRTDNGRTVHVNFGRYDEPRSLDRGDRVRVNGRYEGSIFRATDVQFLRDTGNNNGGWNNGGWNNNQQTTTLTGVVTRDFSGDNFELRTDNGRTVSVRVERGREPRSLDRGDRVRVTGRFTNNTFIARDLDILRDTRR